MIFFFRSNFFLSRWCFCDGLRWCFCVVFVIIRDGLRCFCDGWILTSNWCFLSDDWWFLVMLRCLCLHLDKKKCLYTKTCLCFQVHAQAFFLVDVSYRWNWLVLKYKHKQVSCYLNPVWLTQAFFLVNVSYGNDEVKKNDFGVAFPNGVAIKILILQPLKLQPFMIKLLMWNYILSLLLSRCIFNV